MTSKPINEMSDQSNAAAHWSFWAIGALALIWNAMGVINFFVQMDPDSLASFPESHRSIIEGRPVWATVGFALAVFCGTLGCLLILLRKKISYYFFIASFLGVVITMLHTIGIVASSIDFSIFEIIMMVLMPLLVAVFLIGYSKRSVKKLWLD